MGKHHHRPRLYDFPFTKTIDSRWSDIDRYGHLNNTVYYVLYDALINSYYTAHCGWDPADASQQIGLVVSSATDYFDIVDGFPHPITLGLAVTKLGNSSVEFKIGVFQGAKDQQGIVNSYDTAKAIGKFVHVFVDRSTNKTNPNGLSPNLRNGLVKILKEKPNLWYIIMINNGE